MDDKIVSRKEFFREGFLSILKPLASLIDDKVETRISRKYLRPPGAVDEVVFLTSCTRCPHCAEACPEGAIKMAGPTDGIAAGTPYIDPYDSPCVLCDDLRCIKACPTEALDKKVTRPSDVRMGQAIIEPAKCLAMQGMMCEACFSNCPLKGEAIYMDGLSGPVIREEKCAGCGACAFACVSKPNAVKIVPARR